MIPDVRLAVVMKLYSFRFSPPARLAQMAASIFTGSDFFHIYRIVLDLTVGHIMKLYSFRFSPPARLAQMAASICDVNLELIEVGAMRDKCGYK